MSPKTTGILLFTILCFLSSVPLPLWATSAESDTLFTQGKILFEMGQYEQAKEKFAQHLAEHPDDPLALFYLGKTEFDGVRSQQYFRSLTDFLTTRWLTTPSSRSPNSGMPKVTT